ncbi:Uncharacterized protein HZ326_20107, partial [Fusarium oxysporum f. sp. albedinis]
MAVFAQYDYLFAVGTIFAFLDAWNIGANDVANSWASSVSSRSISYFQAMIGASIMEFTGALGVGGRVADTIRTKIVDVEAFDDSPALLMLGMVCAVVASASYLTFATRFGFPVSTTHSILGGVLGMGVLFRSSSLGSSPLCFPVSSVPPSSSSQNTASSSARTPPSRVSSSSPSTSGPPPHSSSCFSSGRVALMRSSSPSSKSPVSLSPLVLAGVFLWPSSLSPGCTVSSSRRTGSSKPTT